MNLNPKVSVPTLIIALCFSYFLLPKFDGALQTPGPVKNNQALSVQDDGSESQLKVHLSDVPPPRGVPYNIVVKSGSPGTPWVKMYQYKEGAKE